MPKASNENRENGLRLVNLSQKPTRIQKRSETFIATVTKKKTLGVKRTTGHKEALKEV